MPKTTYVWDELSDNVIEEYEDGVLSASYTHEPGLYGNLLSQNRNGVTSYYHYDGRGDTVALTDDSGNVTDTKEYDAWGNVIASTGTTVTPYQFIGRNGYQGGNTGVYVRARMYQLAIVRWTSVDRLFAAVSQAQYRFCQNTHVVRVDPSGHRCQSTFCSKNSPHANPKDDEPDSEGTTFLQAVITTGNDCERTLIKLTVRENHSTFLKNGKFLRCGVPANAELDGLIATGGNFQVISHWDPLEGGVNPCLYSNVWKKDVNGCWNITHTINCPANCAPDRSSCFFPKLESLVLGAWDYGRRKDNIPRSGEWPQGVMPISAVYMAFRVEADVSASCCTYPFCNSMKASFYWADRGIVWNEGEPPRQHGELPTANCDGINVMTFPKVYR